MHISLWSAIFLANNSHATGPAGTTPAVLLLRLGVHLASAGAAVDSLAVAVAVATTAVTGARAVPAPVPSPMAGPQDRATVVVTASPASASAPGRKANMS